LLSFSINVQNTIRSLFDGSSLLGLCSPSFIYITLISSFQNINSQGFSNTDNENLQFLSNSVDASSFTENQLLSSEESSNVYRNQRHQNPIFKPDFKSGNFFTRDDLLRRPALLTTISDLTKGTRKPV